MHPTRRQKQILEALREFAAAGNEAPTLAAIARRCGVRAVSAIHKHLAKLRERGLVTGARGRKRGLVAAPGALAGAAVPLPLLGTIAAGRPIEAIEDRTEISIPAGMARGGRSYVLRVRGDSMRDEQILDGDYVVVEERPTARDGETVVALLHGAEATLKKLRRRRGKIELVPANSEMRPIEVAADRLRIQGVVTGLIRKYD